MQPCAFLLVKFVHQDADVVKKDNEMLPFPFQRICNNLEGTGLKALLLKTPLKFSGNSLEPGNVFQALAKQFP